MTMASAALYLGVAFSIAWFGSAIKTSAADIGLTLKRDQVIKSCPQNTNDWCEHLVFFNYQSRSPNVEQETGNSSFLRNALPTQLGHMPFRPPKEGTPSLCSLTKLENFIQRILLQSHEQFLEDTLLYKTPDEISSCFQTTVTSFRDISFIVMNGRIHGFVSCRPDHAGVALCGVAFSRLYEGRDERISISTFRHEELIEVLSDFPQFQINEFTQQEIDFVNALNWAAGLFSTGVTEVSTEE